MDKPVVYASGGVLPPREGDDATLPDWDCGYVLSAREVHNLGRDLLAKLNADAGPRSPVRRRR